jgi:hypothetical protein
LSPAKIQTADVDADRIAAKVSLVADGITTPGHIIADHIQRVLYNNTVLWEEPGKATV